MATETGTILIADNDDLFRCTMAEVLEREGHQCACVAQISSVMDLIARDRFDLLIVDLEMPGNSQLELFPRLAEKAPQLPVIVVTSHPSLHTALRAIQFQVAAYLVKPFDVKQLLADVQSILARNRLTSRFLNLRNRWLDWSLDLRSRAAAIPPGVEKKEQALALLVETAMRNLGRCFADLQDLQQILSGERISIVANSHLEEETANGINPQKLPLGASAFSSAQSKTAEPMSLPIELVDRLRQLSRREREVLRLLLANQKPQMIAQTLFISPYTVRNHLRSIFDKLEVRSQTELFARLGQHGAYMDILRIM